MDAAPNVDGTAEDALREIVFAASGADRENDRINARSPTPHTV